MQSPEPLKSRPATLDDLEDLLERAREFHGQSLWKDVQFDDEAVTSTLLALISFGGVFLNASGGFVAGALSPLHFSPSTIVATEFAWFAPNGGGRELREAFEEWAKENGATLVQISTLADENYDDTHRNLSRAGFALAELQYVKVL